MPVLITRPTTRAAIAALILVGLGAVIWAGVAASQSPQPPILAAAPDDALAGHGISLSLPKSGEAVRLSEQDALRVLSAYSRGAVRESRLVHFHETRDPEIGPPRDTLAWAMVLDAVAPVSGGPLPDIGDGFVCRRPADTFTKANTYWVVFIDANTGELLANVAGTLIPVPTPVCVKTK